MIEFEPVLFLECRDHSNFLCWLPNLQYPIRQVAAVTDLPVSNVCRILARVTEVTAKYTLNL